jgi:hypothetical protein
MPERSPRRSRDDPNQTARRSINKSPIVEDLKTRIVELPGPVFTDRERARERLESVNTLLNQVFSACLDLKDLADNSTAIETFEAVANALHGVQEALLLFYRRSLDIPHSNAATGASTG